MGPPQSFTRRQPFLSSTDHPQGVRNNVGQFILLLAATAFAVMVTGAERSVLPVLGREEFGVGTTTATLSFIAAFGISKAIADFVAGDLANRLGRHRVLLAGWMAAIPVAPLIIFAPSWSWVVGANVLLGISSAFIQSSSVFMRLDLAGPKQRGLAMGMSGIGPLFLGLTALAAGWLADQYGPRPVPFLIAAAASVMGLLLAFRVRDTGEQARAEQDALEEASASEEAPDGRLRRIAWCSWTRRDLAVANQAGLTLNMSDGVVWGVFPLFLSQQGLGLREVGLIAGIYPIVVGLTEGGTGRLSDKCGRRPLIAGGMLVMAAALAAFSMAEGLTAWLTLAGVMGVGYAAAFPSLTAQAGDLVAPRSRPTAVGVYRMWRDLGHAAGALGAGVLADLLGLRWAMGVMAGVVAVSAVIAARGLPRDRAESLSRTSASSASTTRSGTADPDRTAASAPGTGESPDKPSPPALSSGPENR